MNDQDRLSADDTPAAMPSSRNLVVCCDGTSNTLTGGLEDTNVLRLYSYVRKHADPQRTLLYYDPGVGSPDAAPPTGFIDFLKRRWHRIAGLASGQGVYDNVAEAYAFLMRHWEPKDRIFCFGFSRGAFTARAVVGMVNLFGVLRPEHEPMIPTLVRVYFSQPPWEDQAKGRKSWRRALANWLHVGFARPGKAAAEAGQVPEEVARVVTRRELAQQVRRNFSRKAEIYWVGVWDTVESVGMPLLGSQYNPATATFHDKPNIRNVRHALALDEHRRPFLPRLYDAPSSFEQDGRSLKQVWFPGVHCDVGGSYPAAQRESLHPDGRTGLCDASLAWMVNEVADTLGVPPLGRLPTRAGEKYDDFGMPQRHPFPAKVPLRHDALHDTPLWALAGMTVRRMTVQHVRTNRQTRLEEAGVRVDVRAEGPAHLDGPSVWDERRPLWLLAFFSAIAAIGLVLSGWNLLPARTEEGGYVATMLHALQAAPAASCSFALEQLAIVWPTPLDARSIVAGCGPAADTGLWDDKIWKRTLAVSPAWAMLWDFALIAGLGYLLARAASRVFTWAAGWRRPGQERPWWLLAMGWLPAVAVGSDALENLLTWLALGLHGLDAPNVAKLVLPLVGLCSVLKFAGYGVCLMVFGGGRALLAAWPTQFVGKVGRCRPPESAPVTTAPL